MAGPRPGFAFSECDVTVFSPKTLAACGLFAFSSKATRRYDTVRFASGDALMFGPETRGLPAELVDALPPEQRLRLPMMPGNRSLNLSNTVAVAVYEAWRQRDFQGGV